MSLGNSIDIIKKKKVKQLLVQLDDIVLDALIFFQRL